MAGGVLSTMLRAFAGAGYDVHWHLLDSRRWVAQKRLRLYIIGFRHDLHVSGFVPPGRVRAAAGRHLNGVRGGALHPQRADSRCALGR